MLAFGGITLLIVVTICQVDLSTFEASNTVNQYDKELRRLRQMSSARIIAREISAYQPVQMVKILARRNGDGRSTEGAVMVGSTVRGVGGLTVVCMENSEQADGRHTTGLRWLTHLSGRQGVC